MKSVHPGTKRRTIVVEQTVLTTMEIPIGEGWDTDLTDEGIESICSAAISQRLEVDCGRYSDEHCNVIALARVFNEITEKELYEDDRTEDERGEKTID